MSKSLFSVKEIEETLGVSHATLYSLINSGQLESSKLGRRRVVTQKQLAAFVSLLEGQSGGELEEGRS